MSRILLPHGAVVVAAVACLAWALGGADAAGQGHQHGSHGGHGGTASGPPQGGAQEHAPAAQQSPHGGQLSKTARHTAEVVYQPRETRVYLFGMTGAPVAVKDVQGELAMQVRGSDEVLRVPLKAVALPAAAKGQDYLAAAVDVRGIRDGDMTVTIELKGLPDEEEPQTRFSQTFALSKARPKVVTAALAASDRAGIAQQGVCPVAGGRLGGMGTPVKVLIGGEPLYLCCRGCLRKVQENPEHYLAEAARLRAGQ